VIHCVWKKDEAIEKSGNSIRDGKRVSDILVVVVVVVQICQSITKEKYRIRIWMCPIVVGRDYITMEKKKIPNQIYTILNNKENRTHQANVSLLD